MSFWNRLLGRSTSHKSNLSFPLREELIPGSLAVTIHIHDIVTAGGPISCWSYVTEGLTKHGQKEVVFTLRREKAESVDAFPHDPFHLFRTLHQLAQQGKTVDVGGFTQFGARDFLGGHLIYVHPQASDNLKLPPSALVALLVTTDELKVAQEFGRLRVMARLGEASRFYPYPQWSERNRTGHSFDSRDQSTVLSKVSRMTVPGVRIRQSEGQLTLDCHRNGTSLFGSIFAKIPSDTPVTFLTELHPVADGCLVWRAGQSGPAAITPPGSAGNCLCGCFALFVPNQPHNGGQVVEDGFALMLTAESWSAVRNALTQGQEITVDSTDGMSLSVKWWQEEFINPIDGTNYVAPGGWHTYKPQLESAALQGSRKGKRESSIRLLTGQQELAGRTNIDEMAAFCNKVFELADKHFEGCGQGSKILVDFKCTQSSQEARLASSGDVPEAQLQGFYDSLQALARLPVSEGEVCFQVEIAVSP